MKRVKGQPHFLLKEAAAYLEVPVETLMDRLFEGGGPIHEFRGLYVLYRPTDLDYFKAMGARV